MAKGGGSAVGIGEASALTGISERVLRYYDEKGIVCPSVVTKGGWRRYTPDDLLRLQEVQILRECGYGLPEIDGIVNALRYDPKEALEQELAILEARRAHLDDVIGLVERLMKGEDAQDFDMLASGDVAALRAAYQQHLWAEQGPQKTRRQEAHARRLDEDQRKFAETATQILRVLAEHEEEGPGGEAVQQCVRAWQDCISRYCCPCDNQTLLCLGLLYVRPGKLRDFIDGFGRNGSLSELLCEAIQVHVGNLRP